MQRTESGCGREPLSLFCRPHPNESSCTPPAKTFGASDRESRYKACAHEWLSSLPGVILAVLDVCKLVGVSKFRITPEVLTKLTKVS